MMCIRHGASEYSEDKFEPIKNRPYCIKPDGGLWLSPVDAEYDWEAWCRENDFYLERLDSHFLVMVRGKILKIDERGHLDMLHWIDDETIDFESMLAQGYDAIWLTTRGEHETRYSFPRSLNGWDCESVLVLNKEAIVAPRMKGSCYERKRYHIGTTHSGA